MRASTRALAMRLPRPAARAAVPRRTAARGCGSESGLPTSPTAVHDTLVRQLSGNGEATVLVVTGTELVREAARRQQPAPTACAALGRTLLGTLLLGAWKGDDEVTQVTFNGRGPLGMIKCVADHRGRVRGLVGNRHADLPLRPDGKLNVGEAVGPGTLAVVRSHPFWKEPFTGITAIRSGEIAEDLTYYLADSEQSNSAVGLGVSVNGAGEVLAAGGWMVQVLPFAGEDTLAALERNIAALPAPTELFAEEGATADAVAARILEGMAPEEGARQELAPSYGPCDECELKERMRRAVASLPPAEVRDILEEQGHVEVTDEFCQVVVRFGESDFAETHGDAVAAAKPEAEAEAGGAEGEASS